MRAEYVFSIALLILHFVCGGGQAFGQAGPRAVPSSERGASLNITAARENTAPGPITSKQMTLYEDGIEHSIKSVSPDPSPSRIVLLVDNSRSLRLDLEKTAAALREFAYEIYEGDQLMIVGYDEKAEILVEWTDNAKKIEQSLKALRKQGEPFLFDALRAVVDQALAPVAASTQKRVIVVISDGLDRGSKTKFTEILGDLQRQDITLYAFQIPDRTGGALRRDQPKPGQVIEQLTEGTGGRIVSVLQPRESAKSICDELRNHRYVLSYSPTHISYTDARRLLIVPEEGLTVRHKLMQQPTF